MDTFYAVLPCYAMPKTDESIWSFNLRSYNPRDFSDSDSEDVLVDIPCSDGSTLVDHPLSEDNDTAVYKPNPWSIAKINAASRVAQKYALPFPAFYFDYGYVANSIPHIRAMRRAYMPY
jgi:hypothetical protein